MFLPIGLKVDGKLCLIVGGGSVAIHKCRIMLEHGARVRAVAEEFNDDPVWSHERVEKISAAYEAQYLAGVSLVIAATSDRTTNHRIAQDSRVANCLVLCADSPEDCDWSMPATIRRGAFTASFGTDGMIPALAARVKRDASAIFGEDFARICETARQLRQHAQQTHVDSSVIKEQLRDLSHSLAEFWYLDGVGTLSANDGAGKVYLVGAGPGDTGLITVKGAQCLRTATVVIHDALVNSKLLDMYCGGALRIDVSKRKGMCLHMQPEINQMLLDWARKGHTVVRLKGGDPMIFGRGGEEARALAQAGIDFEIVPGVSSLSSVPAYAGIPVTDREYGAVSLGVYSLHRRNGGGLSEQQWQKMADGPDTIVLLMGMTLLSTAVVKLRQYGREGSTPIALITQGTSSGQREVVATLDTILDCGELHELQGPGLIVIGNVVRARNQMNWFTPEEPARGRSEAPEISRKIVRSVQVAPVRNGGIETQSPEKLIQSTSSTDRALIHRLLAEPMDGDAIEKRSLSLIDQEAPPHRFSKDEWAVVRRMIHTTADFSMMDLIRFSPNAIDAGRIALRSGAPIFADSNMIRAGLSLARLRVNNLGYEASSIHCHVADSDVAELAARKHLPRSVFAVQKAHQFLDGGIALFGNAPVALMELNRMIAEDGIRPALVIAMPVGFVHVVESKEELMSLDVPWIAIPGRRGGSTLAVAALHALCMLEENDSDA